jgi:hypothetical protein
MRVVKLPEVSKPATIGEETFISNQWAPRGDWRRRAMKEKSRNLRDPVLSDRESIWIGDPLFKRNLQNQAKKK